jgi:hypothetical protein
MDQTQSYRGLKALVIGMGVLIIIGTAMVIGVIIHRLYAVSTAPKPEPSPIAARPTAPFHTSLPAPNGGTIKNVIALGHNLAVRVSTPQGGEIVLINPRTGAITGTITLGGAP